MKDERARDKAIERLLARGLRDQACRGRQARRGGQVASPGPNCLEAETLAAYVERTLTPAERLACEAHLSRCLRCQEQVAYLVRASEGETEVEPSPAARRSEPSRAGLPWFRWVWAAPALVAMIVAGLWYTGEFTILLRMRQHEPGPTAPPPPPGRLPSPLGEGTSGAVKAPQSRAVRQEAKRSTAKSGAAKSRGVGEGAGAAVTPPAAVAEPAVAPAGMATPSERARLAGAHRDEGLPSRNQIQEARAPTPEVTAPSLPSPPKAVGEQAAALSGATAREVKKEAMLKRELLAPTNSLAPATGNWRVGPHGLIERLGPEGNWVAVESRVKADLFAIAFPTPVIGWAVGASGTVLRTTDGGATWSKLAFPTTDDLFRVSARSAREAFVETRAGQFFLTSDGGKSWKPLH